MQVGDAIVAANGVSLVNKSMPEFVDVLRKVKAGERVQLRLLRDFSLTSVPQQRLYEVAITKGASTLGVGFGQTWKSGMAAYEYRGLFVSELPAGGLGWSAGCILPGDLLVQVNRELRLAPPVRPRLPHVIAAVRGTGQGDTV